MDLVLPGLNNIARHIRPFTLVTWAWRRAAIRARDQGKQRVDVTDLQDFVDRIEVIYVWSQLMRSPEADLPGREVLAPLIAAGKYRFDGEAGASGVTGGVIRRRSVLQSTMVLG